MVFLKKKKIEDQEYIQFYLITSWGEAGKEKEREEERKEKEDLSQKENCLQEPSPCTGLPSPLLGSSRSNPGRLEAREEEEQEEKGAKILARFAYF